MCLNVTSSVFGNFSKDHVKKLKCDISLLFCVRSRLSYQVIPSTYVHLQPITSEIYDVSYVQYGSVSKFAPPPELMALTSIYASSLKTLIPTSTRTVYENLLKILYCILGVLGTRYYSSSTYIKCQI